MTWPVEIRDEIIRLVGEKNSLAAVCRMPNMPTYRSVMAWLEADPAFAARYVKAKEIAADVEFDEMREIEQRVLSGEIDPRAASVVLSSQQWRLDKMRPKVYGKRTTLTGDVDNPVAVTNVTWTIVKPEDSGR